MASVTAEQTSDLIDQIYEATLNPGSWQGVVDSLGGMFDGSKIAIQAHDFNTNKHLGVLTSGFDPASVASFQQYYSAINPWAPGLAGSPVGQTVLADSLVYRSDLVKTEFYNDWLRPQENLVLGIGTIAHNRDGRFLAISANMRLRDEAATAELVTTFDRISPHLAFSFRVDQLLGHTTLANFMARSANPSAPLVLLLDAALRIVFSNAATGERTSLYRHHANLSGRSFQFWDPIANSALDRSVQAISRNDYVAAAARMAVRHKSAGDAIVASIIPLLGEARRGIGEFREANPAELPVMAVFLTSRQAIRQSQKTTLVGLGLTTVEANLAIALAEGSTVEEIAAQRGTSLHTVRNQFQSIYGKLGIRRQTELAVLVAQL